MTDAGDDTGRKSAEGNVGSSRSACTSRLTGGSLRSGRSSIDSAIAAARRCGTDLGVPAHSLSSAASYMLGDWERALVDGLHGAVMAANYPSAIPFAYSIASWVPAGQGEWNRAEELLSAAEVAASELSTRCAHDSMAIIAIGRAVLAQARNDYEEMSRALEPVVSLPRSGMRNLTITWWLPLYVEALIGTGELGPAARALGVLRGHARYVGSLRLVTAWLAGRLAEARGDLSEAVASYQDGNTCDSGPDDVPLHRALLEGALGLALNSQAWSVSAVRRLQALGANAFTQRFDLFVEEPSNRLNDRESEIVHLVGLGFTNREIAEKLFISRKTVEYHLTNLYAKFSLPNRRRLRDFAQHLVDHPQRLAAPPQVFSRGSAR